MDLRNRIAIDAPPHIIWPLITKLDQIKRWNQSIVSSEAVSAGSVQEGFRSRLMLKEGSREVEYEEEILVFEPPSTVEVQMSGGSLGKTPMVVRYDLSSEGDKTSLEQRCTWTPGGLMLRLMAGIISQSSARALDENLVQIKSVAEADVRGATDAN
ncbi:SRPBCC family protein [Maritalea sp.]|uniref:SRPBCC family protein n=1 Tax=Maritalea sp. TaxID=2003361 RepID=UPI003EF458AC